MGDNEFDRLFLASAFHQIAREGWGGFSLIEAAKDAGLSIARARERFSGRAELLMRFGSMADQTILAEAEVGGTVRDRLFGLIMRRIDVLQEHRNGVLALFRALPGDPPTALLLSCASRRSMSWILSAAGGPVGTGVTHQLFVNGLMAVWLYTVNAWRQDESSDLSKTMAALDNALTRADQAAAWIPGARSAAATPAAETTQKTVTFEPPDPSVPPAI
jgi:hypothetical protein